MPFEWFVALRYLRDVKLQTALILGAVSLGVAVVVFLSALISGLQTSLIGKTLGSQAHVVVHPPDLEARVLVATRQAGQLLSARIEKPSQRLQSIADWPQVLADINRQPGVVATSPLVLGAAFVVRGAASKAVSVRGIEPESFRHIIQLAEKTTAGRYQIRGAEVMLGVDLATDFGLSLGDKIRLITSVGKRASASDGGGTSTGGLGVVPADVFTVVGLFDLGAKDINERLVFIPLRSAQTLFDLASGVSSLEVRVAEIFAAEQTAQAIAQRSGLVADSWTRTNPQLLVALQSQASSKNVILFFITLTVALGIASVLIVSVVQKSREIGIMRAVGTSRARILRVFLIQGGLFGFTGSLLGCGMGYVLATTFVGLSKTADGSPMFPIQLTPMLLVGTTVLATSVGLLAAVAPARRAARLDPAEVIRYG